MAGQTTLNTVATVIGGAIVLATAWNMISDDKDLKDDLRATRAEMSAITEGINTDRINAAAFRSATQTTLNATGVTLVRIEKFMNSWEKVPAYKPRHELAYTTKKEGTDAN